MDPEELQRLIQTAMQGQSAASGAAQQTAAALAQLTRQTQGQATASTLASQAASNLASSQQRAGSAAQAFGNYMESSASRMIGLTSSIYGAEKAFTGFVPALDAYSSMLQAGIKLFASRFEGVGVSVAGFGIQLGKFISAFGEGTARTISLLTEGLKTALDASQKVADSFITVAKYGATFGTSITNFAKMSAELGIPLQQFAKITQANIENISKLGYGTTQGARALGAFANELYRADKALVAQYGSLDDLAKATAEFMSLQSQLGIDTVKNYKVQGEAAREYLFRQKELSNITGKTAERLKQEEEARRNELAYSSKLSRLGEDAKNNVQEGLAMAGKIFGDRGAKYAQEFFATGGRVISKESLEFAALMPDAAETISQFMSTVDRGRDDYRKGNMAYIENNKDALEAQARLGESLAELTYATANPQLKAMSEVNSSILANLTTINGYTKLIMEIEADRAKLGKLGPPTGKLTLGVRQMDMDAATESFVTSSIALQNTQRTLDNFIVNTLMPQMGAVTAQLGNIAIEQVTMVNASIRELGRLKDAYDNAATILENWNTYVESLFKNATAGLGVSQVPQNPPTRATGGLTAGPTIVGENGTEAVIPLAAGNVPLNIDWTPLVNILRENTDLNKEMLDALEDSVSVQERILQASY